jgi:hypothetical protein
MPIGDTGNDVPVNQDSPLMVAKRSEKREDFVVAVDPGT